MLIRISLILAIVAGLAAGVVNFAVVKSKIDVLTTDRNTQRSAKEQAQTELASTKKNPQGNSGHFGQNEGAVDRRGNRARRCAA